MHTESRNKTLARFPSARASKVGPLLVVTAILGKGTTLKEAWDEAARIAGAPVTAEERREWLRLISDDELKSERGRRNALKGSDRSGRPQTQTKLCTGCGQITSWTDWRANHSGVCARHVARKAGAKEVRKSS